MRHAHAYVWLGRRADFDREAERRPAAEPFGSAVTPPLLVAHWLRRPPHLVLATFEKPEEAVDWLAERAGEYGARWWPPLRVRRERALGTLSWGGDVSWGCYVGGDRFLSLALVSCPNRTDPDAACPLR
ncbi:hypothetical protein [Streptomyces sp. MP131-18]|uniref:hypothetical protein n=1 Tax=Streptomyces sp. MP131-18 TaxID=1857892 RepID=UPI0009A1DA00|nr:hypothetical protein [Streptomyces sp. MP131-18]ONK14522.1 hypothetical protein STBA_53070 [Streptomyces sp. MP131-18]